MCGESTILDLLELWDDDRIQEDLWSSYRNWVFSKSIKGNGQDGRSRSTDECYNKTKTWGLNTGESKNITPDLAMEK